MENKKTRRKLNFLDVIIIIVVLGALAFGAYKLMPTQTQSNFEYATIKFYASEAPYYVLDQIYTGAPVSDADRSIYLGYITDIETWESKVWDVDADGMQVASPKDDAGSIIITVRKLVEPSAYGVKISGVEYGVGHTIVIRAGFAKINMVLYDIEYDNPDVPLGIAKGITGN